MISWFVAQIFVFKLGNILFIQLVYASQDNINSSNKHQFKQFKHSYGSWIL